MRLPSSRWLSIIVAVASLYRVWPNATALLRVVLIMAVPIVLIWFPEQIDEYTFGTWDRGNRIDTHTPPAMIALFGWVILLLEASIIFNPTWVMRFLYGA
jgi:hypothetical protein